jgi:hypothetical protein
MIMWPKREGACRRVTSVRDGSESRGFIIEADRTMLKVVSSSVAEAFVFTNYFSY